MTTLIPKHIVPKFYEYDPDLEDVLFDGRELQPDMIVLVENPLLRGSHVEHMIAGNEETYYRYLETNRYAMVDTVENMSDGTTDLLVIYSDGLKRKRHVLTREAWIVRKDSLPPARKASDVAAASRALNEAGDKIIGWRPTGVQQKQSIETTRPSADEPSVKLMDLPNPERLRSDAQETVDRVTQDLTPYVKTDIKPEPPESINIPNLKEYQYPFNDTDPPWVRETEKLWWEENKTHTKSASPYAFEHRIAESLDRIGRGESALPNVEVCLNPTTMVLPSLPEDGSDDGDEIVSDMMKTRAAMRAKLDNQ